VASEVGRRFYPTRVVLPLWAQRGVALTRFRVSDIRVKSIDPVFVKDRGLLGSKTFPRLPITLDSKEHFSTVSKEVPMDGVEIVWWMYFAAADNAMLDARCEEYNRLGSQLVGLSSDPYIPGVTVEDCNYQADLGRTVSERGYGVVVTPRGNFNVSAGGRGDGIFRDLLTWGAIPWVAFTQWIGTLLKWKELARTPINDAIGFPNSQGLSGPQYIILQSSRPALRVSVTMGMSCSEAERLNLTWRDPSDFTRGLAQDWIDLPAGSSEISYTVISFPYVPPSVYHMQPEDLKLTRLDYLRTYP